MNLCARDWQGKSGNRYGIARTCTATAMVGPAPLCNGSVKQCGASHGEEMPLRRQGSTPQGAQTQRTTNYPFSRGAGLKSALRRAHEREDGDMENRISELTLRRVKSDKVMLAILEVVDNENIDVLEADRGHVKVMSGCLPVKITWEMCMCHGGRLWLYQEQTNISIELSSDEYDEDKGIVSPETELAWRIDNELIDTIDSFRRYVHVVDSIGEYGDPDRKKREYFDSADKAARRIFEEEGIDLFSTESFTHQYPNQNMRMRITYMGDEREDNRKARRIRFKCEKLERRDQSQPFRVAYEFTREYWVYRKGLV